MVTDSGVISTDIIISRTLLPAPAIIFDDADTQRGDVVEIEKLVDGGDMPVGARIYYTIDGTDPGDDGNGNPLSGTLYTGPSTRLSLMASPSTRRSSPASTHHRRTLHGSMLAS